MANRRYELTDEQWAKIESVLPGRKGSKSRPAHDNRRFINGVMWVADRAYDSNSIISRSEKTGTIAVIPATSKRRIQREHDRELYKTRNQFDDTP